MTKLGLGRPRYPYEEYMHGCCTGVDALAEDVREGLDDALDIVVDGEREESNRDDGQYDIVRCGVFRKRPTCFTKDSVASCLL